MFRPALLQKSTRGKNHRRRLIWPETGSAPMTASQTTPLSIVSRTDRSQPAEQKIEPPMNVKEAAKFLGVSPPRRMQLRGDLRVEARSH
jgi:hypothetical protein